MLYFSDNQAIPLILSNLISFDRSPLQLVTMSDKQLHSSFPTFVKDDSACTTQ